MESEINGLVESSTDLFVDSEISSEAKLWIVMLTSGCGSYFLNNAPYVSDIMDFKRGRNQFERYSKKLINMNYMVFAKC